MESISNRIKSLRKVEGLTQKEFANRLLVSQSYLSGLENGNEIPTNKLTKLICLEFGVNESWLISGLGEMYDNVYENERSTLAEISNSALLKILSLLSTKSNVEYGYFANSINLLADLLTQGLKLGEDTKLDYFENIQNLLMDIERAIYVTNNVPEHTLENHKEGVIDDITQIFRCFQK